MQAVVNTRSDRISLIFPNIMLSKGQYSSGEVSNGPLVNTNIHDSDKWRTIFIE